MPAPDEFQIQRALCIHLDGSKDVRTGLWRTAPALAPGVVYWHTPNGGNRSGLEAKRFKEMGVKAGIPDLLFLARGRLYGIEFKKPGGVLSDAQLKMHPRLTGAGIADILTTDSLDEAKRFCRDVLLTVNIT